MNLSELHRDALGEIFNMGVGRAAHSLSQLVNATVDLTAPSVTICAPNEVCGILVGAEFSEVSAVSQSFSGPFDTTAMLVFPESQALEIVRLMMGSTELSLEEVSEYEQESMCEIGNIILNACISALADCFGVHISGGLPVHHFSTPENLVQSSLSMDQDHSCLLLLKVTLSVRNQCINGHVIFLMNISSLNLLFACVDKYLDGLGVA